MTKENIIMLAQIIIVGFLVVAVVVISLMAIVMSTSKGSQWSETLWRAVVKDETDRQSR